jgi:exodeoxyribonuclease X
MNLIFLDTETTGNEPGKDRLCQVCYKVGDKTITEYFKPPVPMTVKSMSITHITNKMLIDKPAFIGSQMYIDLEVLLRDHILVAHTAKFDIGMLKAEGLEVPQHICTLRVARHLDTECVIPEYNLQFLRYYLDLEVPGTAHDAEGDVNVLVALFERLFAKVKETEKTDEQTLQKMIEISTKPTLFKKFQFGKYKGQDIAEVMKTDRGYLEWLLKQKLSNEDEDEDWIFTLQSYLK